MNGLAEEESIVPRTVGGYWKVVAARALNDSLTTLAIHAQKATVGVIFTIIAAIILYYLNKDAETGWAKFQWSVLLLCAVLVSFPFLYIKKFFITPFLLQSELSNKFDGIKARLSESTTEQQQEIADLQKENERLQNVDSGKRIILSELNKRLEGFQRIRELAENHHRDAIEHFYSLDEPTFKYIRDNVQGFIDYARGRRVTSTYTRKVQYADADFAWVVGECDQRIEALTELIRLQS